VSKLIANFERMQMHLTACHRLYIYIFREWTSRLHSTSSFMNLIFEFLFCFTRFGQCAIKVIKLIRFIGTRHVVLVSFQMPNGQSFPRRPCGTYVCTYVLVCHARSGCVHAVGVVGSSPNYTFRYSHPLTHVLPEHCEKSDVITG